MSTRKDTKVQTHMPYGFELSRDTFVLLRDLLKQSISYLKYSLQIECENAKKEQQMQMQKEMIIEETTETTQKTGFV